MMALTCPPSRSFRAGAVPLYGTTRMSSLASCLMASSATCMGDPTAEVPKVNLAGLVRAWSMNSLRLAAGTLGWAASSMGTEPSSEMGVKSLAVS